MLQVVAAWRDRRVTLVASPRLLDELTEVLARSARADMIVSVDRDLLEAGLDDVLVVRPEELLDRLDSY